jgi:aminoglycoside/choline kinase family phosphotransferase
MNLSDSNEAWIRKAVAIRWPRSRIAAIEELKGDASTRRFWRVRLQAAEPDAPDSTVAIDLGPDDLPLYARALKLVPEPLSETPWLNLHRYLSRIGAPVPALYYSDPPRRMLLVEDVGSLPLFEAAQYEDAADLYRLAADELIRLHLEGTRELDPGCLAANIAYDARLFRWELEQFVEYAGDIIAAQMPRDAIASELDQLSERLGRYPRVFSHRDFHGQNLFVQYGAERSAATARIRIIDFQDALMAPPAQDLAVLLTTRDTSRIITPRMEQRVVEYYYSILLRRGAAMLGADDFFESYRLCVLQHALKVIGRFIYLEREGKTGYAAYIPYARTQARRMLGQISGFAALRAALAE